MRRGNHAEKKYLKIGTLLRGNRSIRTRKRGCQKNGQGGGALTRKERGGSQRGGGRGNLFSGCREKGGRCDTSKGTGSNLSREKG